MFLRIFFCATALGSRMRFVASRRTSRRLSTRRKCNRPSQASRRSLPNNAQPNWQKPTGPFGDASMPELDDFLGQVMAAISRQLSAVSSTLRMLNLEQNTLALELLFQDGRVMSPAEAKYPENFRSLSLNEERVAALLDKPTTVIRILSPCSLLSEDHCSYLLGLSIKTLLIIPLTLGGRANGQLDFRFTEERDFSPEELEIARALATQASLAIQLTRLAKTARQAAILEEQNRLAGEIHDALAQSFTGISMQLEVAQEEMAANEGGTLDYIQRANEMAKFGLAAARRAILGGNSEQRVQRIQVFGPPAAILPDAAEPAVTWYLISSGFRCSYLPTTFTG